MKKKHDLKWPLNLALYETGFCFSVKKFKFSFEIEKYLGEKFHCVMKITILKQCKKIMT